MAGSKKRGNVSIRIDHRTRAALDIIAAELQVRTRHSITQNDAIWHLIEVAAPHVAERIRKLEQSRDAKPEEDE
jgi:DNA repair photolyase